MARYCSSLLAPTLIACTIGLAAASPAVSRRLPFLAGTHVGLLTSADALVTADFDGDGDLDFAATNSVIDRVVWMEQTATGFVEHTITTALDAPQDLAAADIDCDGDSDLVVAVFNTGSVVWERNDSGATSWALGGTISSTISGVIAVAAGKLTGNDTVDVVAASVSAADEIVAWSHPSCSSAVWNAAVVSSALGFATDVAMADTNADGSVDVVATLSGRVAVFEHGAGNTFTRVDVDTGFGSPQAVAVGDVDRDGDLDLAATSNTLGEVAWWANPGAAGAWTKQTVSGLAAAGPLALGDIDGDGDLDVAAGSTIGSAPLQWWDNASGDGSAWTAQELDAAAGAGRELATVDEDGDGDADVVAGAAASGVEIYENDSTHRSAELGTLEHFFYSYGTGGDLVDLTHADVDADGLLDVVAVWEGSSSPNSSVQWFKGLGGSASYGVLQFDSLAHDIQTGVVHFFESVAMGDVDRDGDVDAFVGATWFPSDAYSFCRNDGGGTAWTCFFVGDAHWVVDAVELADVDADRDLDVVAVAQETIGGPWVVLWWENAGDPTVAADWIRHDIASDGPYDKLRVVDLDGDVDLDVVAGADWWRNDGGTPPVWVAQTIPNVWNPLFTMSSWALADIDVDGDLDMAAESSTNGLLWSRNNLPSGWVGSEFQPPSATTGPAGDFALADMDSDGDPDLVAGMVQTSPSVEPRVSWWENDARTDPFAWTEHPFEPRGTSASHLQVADFDRDGDPDVVMAASTEFVSWFNGGGQVALEARAVGGPSLRDGLEEPVLAIDAYHRGRNGEASAEVEAVSLLFESTAGTPLTQPQFDALVDAVRLYRDDGSGGFDAADTLVGEAGSLILASGEGVLALADGLSALQHTPAETPGVYYLTLDMTPAASTAGAPSLLVTHTPGTPCVECDAFLPVEGSAAENASFDVPMVLEVARQRTASFAVVADTFGGDGFTDGFESGTTLVWSASIP